MPVRLLRIAGIALIQHPDLLNIVPLTPDMPHMLDSALAAQTIA